VNEVFLNSYEVQGQPLPNGKGDTYKFVKRQANHHVHNRVALRLALYILNKKGKSDNYCPVKGLINIGKL